MSALGFAVPDEVPPTTKYLTPGKRYSLVSTQETMFTIRDDDDDLLICLWVDCAHLKGRNWRAEDGE